MNQEQQGQNNSHYVRCLKCGKILHCSRYDTAVLLEHIRNDHPEIEIVDNSSNKSKTDKGSSKETTSYESSKSKTVGTETVPTKVPDSDPVSESIESKQNEFKPPYRRRYKVQPQSVPPKCCRYRASIEHWRPAEGSLYCPKCGCVKRPQTKTRNELLQNSSLGSACILSCWPLCFLPCCLPDANKQYLHCANCQVFLGLYDRNTNCIRPNKEFITYEISQAKFPQHN